MNVSPDPLTVAAVGGAPQESTSRAAHVDAAGLRWFVFALFFIFGGITSLNDVVIPKLKGLFTLTNGEVMLVQTAFFAAYFLFSLPAAVLVRRAGYMRGAAIGLLLMAAGCLLFIPASAAGIFAAFLAAWIMSQLEKRPMAVYGLPARGAFGKQFWLGCLFGFCEICALMALISAFGGYSFGSLAEHGGAIAKWALFWAVFFIIVGLFEEFLFRGYSLYTLADGVGFWPAALLLAGMFGWVHKHNSGEDWIGVAGVVFVGLFWSFTLKRTGSLWFALGMHAAFDFGETFLFSVPDSGMIFPGHLSNATLHGPNWLTGGTPGPEASVFDFLILAVFFFLFDRLYPARHAQRYVPPAN